jgi:hypothetical protein
MGFLHMPTPRPAGISQAKLYYRIWGEGQERSISSKMGHCAYNLEQMLINTTHSNVTVLLQECANGRYVVRQGRGVRPGLGLLQIHETWW